jgi:TPR repeat protein
LPRSSPIWPSRSPTRPPRSRSIPPPTNSAEAKGILLFIEAKAAAAGGEPEKLMALANYYLIGIGTEKNEAESARLHRQAAEQGHAPCGYYYGCSTWSSAWA